MGIGIGFLVGVVLFLILAGTGQIDKWTNRIEKWLARK
jgi:hypothetical protein